MPPHATRVCVSIRLLFILVSYLILGSSGQNRKSRLEPGGVVPFWIFKLPQNRLSCLFVFSTRLRFCRAFSLRWPQKYKPAISGCFSFQSTYCEKMSRQKRCPEAAFVLLLRYILTRIYTLPPKFVFTMFCKFFGRNDCRMIHSDVYTGNQASNSLLDMSPRSPMLYRIWCK